MRKLVVLLAVSFALFGACSPGTQTPGRFGEITSAVIIVNPRINQGSSTTVASGTQRADVAIQPGNQDAVRTDSTGLAVAQGFPTGTLPLAFDTGTVNLNVVANKELYDVVVSYTPSGVREIIPAVRYPIGGTVKVVQPGESIASAASSDDSIVVLRAGTYSGSLELTAANVLVFGEWAPDGGSASIIDGSLTVRGGGNRLRGVRVNGALTSNANNFSAAFCELGTANITGNGVTLIRNSFSGGSASVPSSNAVLVDNSGIP
jgi:hypothetical protein